MRVPFLFSLDGSASVYGTPFSNTAALFATSVANVVLTALDSASVAYSTVGIILPPTDKAYKLGAVHIELTDLTLPFAIGINGSTSFAPIAAIGPGQTDYSFGDGWTVPAGFTPHVSVPGLATTLFVSGWVDWIKVF